MRQDENGRSLEKIDADDREYNNGLQIVEENIRKRKKEIIEDKSLNEIDKKEQHSEVNKSEKKLNKHLKNI